MRPILKFYLPFLIILSLTVFTYSQNLPQPDHIILVIEENHGYSQIIGGGSAPYINILASDSLGALFTNYYAVTHPSQPNYLWLYSGNNQGVTNDNTPADTPFTTLNLGAELLHAGYSFCGYAEDLPYIGSQAATSSAYARKHNPWVNWQNGSTNGIPDSVNMPMSSFPDNYSTLPKIGIVIPNLNDDMHNGTIAQADTWLKNNLDGYIQWAKSHNSLFILTFDEDENTEGNRVATIFVGSMVKHGHYARLLNHINLLRTLEDMYTLAHAGSSADSTSITECWNTSTTPVKDISNMIKEFKLEQNFPNPFNPSTVISYRLSKENLVKLYIYDILGRKVSVLVNKVQPQGKYEVHFNGSELPSGIYFYMLRAGNFEDVKKLNLLK